MFILQLTGVIGTVAMATITGIETETRTEHLPRHKTLMAKEMREIRRNEMKEIDQGTIVEDSTDGHVIQDVHLPTKLTRVVQIVQGMKINRIQ